MNKKIKYQLILIILIGFVLMNTAIIIIISNPDETTDDTKNPYNITTVGSNENGTVYKIIGGNNTSNDTVGVILGVHPREHEVHEEVNKTLANLTGENELSKKFVVYYVVANDNLTSREETRSAGENLAHDFVVPNIKTDNPFVVIDVHEIDPKYEYSNFIYSISNNSAKADDYAHIIAKNLSIENFNFTEGTSPAKVTEPIANQGINTLLLETDITNSIEQKHDLAVKLIYTLDNLKK